MNETRFSKYIKVKPVGDFKKLYPALTAPSFHIPGSEWNSGYNMDWFCVTEPFLMINQPHTHDFDQYLAFQGGNPQDVNEFDAEVWLYLGAPGKDQEKLIITETCVVHIPKGLVHTPLEFRRIGKPIVFMDIVLTAKYIRKPNDGSAPIVHEHKH
jgi:hypothetical protein